MVHNQGFSYSIWPAVDVAILRLFDLTSSMHDRPLWKVTCGQRGRLTWRACEYTLAYIYIYIVCHPCGQNPAYVYLALAEQSTFMILHNSLFYLFLFPSLNNYEQLITDT